MTVKPPKSDKSVKAAKPVKKVPKKAANKDETFWLILNCAIEMDFKIGHLKWSMSDLARKSGVTRSLIYYYFGPSRQDIINEAVRSIGEDYFGLTLASMSLWQSGDVGQAVSRTAELVRRSPYLVPFYLNYRSENSSLGETLRTIENKYYRKMLRFFPDRGPEAIEAIWCYIFGLVVAPSLAGTDRNHAIKLLVESSARANTNASETEVANPAKNLA